MFTKRIYVLLFAVGLASTGFVLALSATWTSKTITMHLYQEALTRNIAVINVEVSKTVVGQNYSTIVNVTVENQGEITEVFDVAVYATTILIDSFEVTLASGSLSVILLPWNTTGVVFGNYTIETKATLLAGETNLADNTYVDGWVVVTIPGDVTGNYTVDHKDLLLLASAYGSEVGDANYIPEADIDCSGKVDHEDLLILAANYGKEI